MCQRCLQLGWAIHLLSALPDPIGRGPISKQTLQKRCPLNRHPNAGYQVHLLAGFQHRLRLRPK